MEGENRLRGGTACTSAARKVGGSLFGAEKRQSLSGPICDVVSETLSRPPDVEMRA
jgi:hypothetical protein